MTRIVKLTEKFGHVMDEIVTRGDDRAEKEFDRLFSAVNGAAQRLGLPYDLPPAVRPAPGDIDEFIDDVIRKGEERGGELTW